MSMDSQGTKRRRKIAENFNWLSRVHRRYRQTDDRQTDGRAMAYSERGREFTFANKLTHALPAYAGHLTADDKNRINATSRKAMRRGLTLTAFDIDTLIDESDRKLFR